MHALQFRAQGGRVRFHQRLQRMRTGRCLALHGAERFERVLGQRVAHRQRRQAEGRGAEEAAPCE
jgi:hypothetical protein